MENKKDQTFKTIEKELKQKASEIADLIKHDSFYPEKTWLHTSADSHDTEVMYQFELTTEDEEWATYHVIAYHGYFEFNFDILHSTNDHYLEVENFECELTLKPKQNFLGSVYDTMIEYNKDKPSVVKYLEDCKQEYVMKKEEV